PDTAAPPLYPLSLHDALPISQAGGGPRRRPGGGVASRRGHATAGGRMTLVFMEGAEDELSRQALTLAESLGGAVRAVTVDGPYADRKSTRLNSSHLGISYAVF